MHIEDYETCLTVRDSQNSRVLERFGWFAPIPSSVFTRYGSTVRLESAKTNPRTILKMRGHENAYNEVEVWVEIFLGPTGHIYFQKDSPDIRQDLIEKLAALYKIFTKNLVGQEQQIFQEIGGVYNG
jgi:hypothetical protein